MDGWKDGWMDGWMEGWMDGWKEGSTVNPTTFLNTHPGSELECPAASLLSSQVVR